MNALPTKLLPV